MIRKYKPALVILDVDLESGVGFEVFEQTRDLDYQKIIICDTPSYVIKAMRFNVDDYLVNPMSSLEIEASIEKLLFKKKRFKIQELFDRGRKPLVTLSTLFLESIVGPKAVRVKDIVRITSMGEQCKLHFADRSNLVFQPSLPRMMELLGRTQVWQTTEDEAINFAHVTKVVTKRGKFRAHMRDGHAVWLSHTLHDRWEQYHDEDDEATLPHFPLGGNQ